MFFTSHVWGFELGYDLCASNCTKDQMYHEHSDMIYASYNIWAACFCSSVSLWASHLTSNTGHNQRPTQSSSFSPRSSPFTVLPPSSCLSSPLSLSVGMLGEQRLIARGKSSTLLGWPSSGRVIHPYPFTSPDPLHCALFPFSPPSSGKTTP